jgi:hypothetical protein
MTDPTPVHISRRQFVALGGAALTACAAPGDFKDGSAIAPDRALVLVHPRYALGRFKIQEVHLGLTRIDPGKSPSDLVLSLVPNNQVSVLEVPPGVYFLRRVHALNNYYRHTFDPRLTLFAARSGPINYPGDWVVGVGVVSNKMSGTLGNFHSSTEYQIEVGAEVNEDVPAMLASRYPALNAKLPLKVTRLMEE